MLPSSETRFLRDLCITTESAHLSLTPTPLSPDLCFPPPTKALRSAPPKCQQLASSPLWTLYPFFLEILSSPRTLLRWSSPFLLRDLSITSFSSSPSYVWSRGFSLVWCSSLFIPRVPYVSPPQGVCHDPSDAMWSCFNMELRLRGPHFRRSYCREQ